MTMVRAFQWPDFDPVLALWTNAGFTIGPSETREGIAARLERDPDLFLVATDGDAVVGAVLAAFDGRRGWIYLLAAAPDHQRQGVGSTLLAEAERRLRANGCVKVNLLIARHNAVVAAFDEGQGYVPDDLLFMSKWVAAET